MKNCATPHTRGCANAKIMPMSTGLGIKLVRGDVGFIDGKAIPAFRA